MSAHPLAPRLPAELLNTLGGDVQATQATVAAAGGIVPVVYGRARLGARVFAVGVDGNDLVLGCGWCVGEIDAVESITINDQAAPAGVTVTHYLGTATQGVDPDLAAAISGYADDLITTVAGQTVAVAYSVLRVPAGSVTGFPRVAAVIRGRKIYDPRTSATAYSANPALALGDFLGNAVYGQGRAVDWSSTAAADACDEVMADGAPRRAIGIVIDRQALTGQWIDTLRSYAACFIVPEGNRVRLVPDRPAASVAALTASDVVQGSLRLSRRSRRNAPTVVRVDWTDTSATPWLTRQVTAYAAGVDTGATPWREETLSLPGIPAASQAYREAVERLNDARLADLDVEWLAFDEAIQYQIGDVVTLTHPLGLNARELRILAVDPAGPGRHRIRASVYDAGVYSDALATNPSAAGGLPSPNRIGVPTGLALASGSQYLVQGSDGTIVSRIFVSWTPPSDIYLWGHDVEYRVAGAADWIEAQVSGASAICAPVVDGAVYDVRVRARNLYGITSDWVSGTHTVVGKSEPPPDVDSFTVVRQADGTRQFDWTYSSPPVDHAGFVIRYGIGSGLAWNQLTPLHNGLLQAGPWETNQLARGLYTLAIKAVDTSGNESANATFVTADLDDPRLAGVITVEDAHVQGWPGTITQGWIDGAQLLAADTKTWDDFALDGVTWDAWTSWARAPYGSLTYEHPAIDAGVVTTFTPLISVVASGTVTVEVSTSSDGTTWSAWAVPSGPVTARYLKARATVTDSLASMQAMSIILDARPVQEEIEDLDTATLTGDNRIATGDIRLPITESYSVIRAVNIALQNTGAGWSWEVVDKDVSIGPRIRIYDNTGALADATIDALLRGI